MIRYGANVRHQVSVIIPGLCKSATFSLLHHLEPCLLRIVCLIFDFTSCNVAASNQLKLVAMNSAETCSNTLSWDVQQQSPLMCATMKAAQKVCDEMSWDVWRQIPLWRATVSTAETSKNWMSLVAQRQTCKISLKSATLVHAGPGVRSDVHDRCPEQGSEGPRLYHTLS